MKNLLFSAALICSFSLAKAQPPKGPATPGTVYGANLTATSATPIAELPAMLAKNDSINVAIEAKVLEVCPKKGCWVKLQVNDSTTAFVKMKGYAFFVPVDLEGKTILLEGVAKVSTTSVERLRHYAEDAKKSKEEIEAITQPKKEISLLASGIKVK
ncbi:DUF4920 domain-containing protein [Pseudoflavitalea sp. G-6-1-2]|uniref:DUF4920 domain-containing protein n=1 Tax=Pseudoflavitalea sp. G-6-1-2 TaxID=2728841 RepID=UPI00146F0B50|nr:DUF4920 domain-containing protein [Pseudoflavitalea sp. G-6-1-2]NML21919.1 DUF4920 domain-containing protein [Pseudoflavitalea sp. G-6-1-2]